MLTPGDLMRHLVLVLALALAALTPSVARAQHDPASHAGSLKVSGQTGLGFTKTVVKYEGQDEQLEISSRAVRLEAYYLVVKYAGVGFWLDHTRAKATYLGESATSAETRFGPALTLVLPLGDFDVHWQGAWLFERSSLEQPDEPAEELKSSGFAAGIGLSYFPARAVSVEVGLNGSTIKNTVEGFTTSTSSLTFGVGLSVYFGGAGGGDEDRFPTTGAGNPRL